MYESFYGLHSKPFQLNPDPEFYFGSKQHRRAKAYLEYGVQRSEGFIVITGDVGAGKTTLVRGLLASLDPEQVVAANLVTTTLDGEDVVRMVGAAFGVRVKDVDKVDVLMALEAFLVTQVSQGKRCLLIVDEAQNLTPQAVEELRMLSNFQYGQQALLQTFLVGQPEFRAILQSESMQQLRQRVSATCHIGPLDAAETQAYIEHRLNHAGASDKPAFEPAAFQAIHDGAGGIPRRINLLCDRLLLLGLLSEKFLFSADDVQEVVNEMADESSYNAPPSAGRSAPAQALQMPAPELELDLARLLVTPGLAEEIANQIDNLGVEQYDERLRRMERSVLRLERLNLEILVMLQKLVATAAVPDLAPQP
jgi:putative secretion ATPase (PEP-CTERM system associated)